MEEARRIFLERILEILVEYPDMELVRNEDDEINVRSTQDEDVFRIHTDNGKLFDIAIREVTV